MVTGNILTLATFPKIPAVSCSTIAIAVTFDELANSCYTVGELLEKQMTVGELCKLVGEIRQRKAEGQTVEVKSAQYGCPNRDVRGPA